MTIETFPLINRNPGDWNNYTMAQELITEYAIPGLISALQAAGWILAAGSVYSLFPDNCGPSSVVPQELEERCLCAQLGSDMIIAIGYNYKITKLSSGKLEIKEYTSSSSSSYNKYIYQLYFYVINISNNNIIGTIYNTYDPGSDTYARNILVINNKYIIFTSNNKLAAFTGTGTSSKFLIYINYGENINSLIVIGGSFNQSGYTILNRGGQIYKEFTSSVYYSTDSTFTYKLRFYTYFYTRDIYNLCLVWIPRALCPTHGHIQIVNLNGLDFFIVHHVAVCISV